MRGRNYEEIWVREKFGENQRILKKIFLHKIKLVLLETVQSMETFSRPESDRLFQKRASNGK